MADVAQAPATARLSEAIGRLRIQSVRAKVNERTLMYAGGALGVLGLAVVWLGWWGASRNATVPEQLPYLLSGGLFGLGLVFLGGFAYFAYWITRLVQEQRRQTDVLLEALTALRPTQAVAEIASMQAAAAGDLVATAKGSMAHTTECSVVAGKRGLRKVSEADGLAPCALCNPY